MLAFIAFEGMETGNEILVNHVEFNQSVVRIDIQRWAEKTAGDTVSYYGVIVEIPQNKKSDTIEVTFTKQRPPATRDGRNDKVLVTGVGEVLDLSYAEIADKLNKAGNDSYMPWAYAKFTSGTTERDVELLHELVKENQQIRMIILSPE